MRVGQETRLQSPENREKTGYNPDYNPNPDTNVETKTRPWTGAGSLACSSSLSLAVRILRGQTNRRTGQGGNVETGGQSKGAP